MNRDSSGLLYHYKLPMTGLYESFVILELTFINHLNSFKTGKIHWYTSDGTQIDNKLKSSIKISNIIKIIYFNILQN